MGTVGRPNSDTSSTITVIDAERSLPTHGSGVLLRVKDIGVLHVKCSPQPRSQLLLTHFAAGEGPPVIHRDSSPASGRTSISGSIGSAGGFTGELGTLAIPEHNPTRQVLDRYDMMGGGEAFQFTVNITTLLTPTTTRCDLVAQATIVTHGPFYRDAHASPEG